MFVLLLGVKETAMADWDDFELLKQVTGEFYDTRRDALLRSTPDLKARLAGPEAQGDWYNTIMRRILAGWGEHSLLYRRVLADLDAVDVARESRKVAGISAIWDEFALKAATQYKADILPLCWEVLLKHAGDWPTWKLVAFLHATAAVPAPESIDPVFWFLEHVSNPQLQDVAGQTIRKLPKDELRSRLDQAEANHAHILEVLRHVKARLE
jgi:hypothetical protein